MEICLTHPLISLMNPQFFLAVFPASHLEMREHLDDSSPGSKSGLAQILRFLPDNKSDHITSTVAAINSSIS
ncbi:hypothetical protein PCANC_25090 [Puccinia coronata f. sp. avenae]|uniref:Uncharacterized protein n=1 Tax=Puccinia coronata f. sp. avenae TaxID=200324 RepID=A0A2N5TAH8_9BASI|nr:hypothetical protein PCANC_25090 [Puccinia coronata f. sp. avenae]